MKAIIIGAGRGSRLRPLTDDQPKCCVEVGGRPIVEWILEALRDTGLDDVVFVGGYRIGDVRARYPKLTFVENPDWERTNILWSLMCAREHMSEGFVCAYADTVLTHHAVRPLLTAPHSIALSLDTGWNDRHGTRPQAYDAAVEGTYVEGDRVTRIERVLPPGDALGEYTGVARLDPAGATAFVDAFDRARSAHAGQPFHHAPTFEKAYFVDLIQEMIDAGQSVGYATSKDAYLEIDTVEDYDLANAKWVSTLAQR